MHQCEPFDSFIRNLSANGQNFQFLIEPDLTAVGNFFGCFNNCLQNLATNVTHSINLERSNGFYPNDLTNNLIGLINSFKIRLTISKQEVDLLTISFISNEESRLHTHKLHYRILFRNYAKIELRNLPSSKGEFVIRFVSDVDGHGPRKVEAFVVPTDLGDQNPFVW